MSSPCAGRRRPAKTWASLDESCQLITILGYGDRLSAQPGETIEFKISVEDDQANFSADVVRLTSTDEAAAGPGLRESVIASLGVFPAFKQVTYSGSHAVIPADPVLDGLDSFRVSILVWATKPGGTVQGLFAKYQDGCPTGWVLALDEAGEAAFLVGGAVVATSGRPILPRCWTRVAVSVDAPTGTVTLVQQPLAPWPLAHRPIRVQRHVEGVQLPCPGVPLVIAGWHLGAANGRYAARGVFNGKLARPRLWAGAAEDLGTDPAVSVAPMGSWDFGRGIDTNEIEDTSGHNRHGRTRNLPTRAVTGPDWTGKTLAWTEAPHEYDAIWFHDDDLDDCGWRTDVTYQLPANIASGVYALRCTTATGTERIPFFVRPRRGTTTSHLAVLMPTATYIVYGNQHAAYDEPLDEMMRGRLTTLDSVDLYLNEHRELGLSSYDTHADGSGVFYVSRHRPILNMRPLARQWNFNVDMHIVAWLEARGTPYDILTDEDLEQDGAELLRPYRCVIACCHPEYWSAHMLAALMVWRDEGGRLMYLGGNGFYWRISFHPTRPGIIEARRTEGSRSWHVDPGERHHAFDGAAGGLWRFQKPTPYAVVGVGMNSEGFDRCGWYRRLPGSFDGRASWIFAGVGDDERIGDFGLCGGGAAGWETDRMDVQLGTPPHALLLATSEGLSRYYELVVEELAFTLPAFSADETDWVRADMVFFETPHGGAVFSVGSIAWSGSLPWNGFDNNVARITGNVLDRFLDPRPLEPPV